MSSASDVAEDPGPLSSGPFLFLFLFPCLFHCSDVPPSAEASFFPRGVAAQPAAASCAALTVKGREVLTVMLLPRGDTTGMQLSFFGGVCRTFAQSFFILIVFFFPNAADKFLKTNVGLEAASHQSETETQLLV